MIPFRILSIFACYDILHGDTVGVFHLKPVELLLNSISESISPADDSSNEDCSQVGGFCEGTKCQLGRTNGERH